MPRRTFQLIAALAVILLAVAILARPVDAQALASKKERIIWSLSSISNINAGLVGTKEELHENARKIGEFLSEPAVEAFTGPLELVWGPAIVNKGLPHGWRTVNTMFVARGADPETGDPLYVVAVAGTHIASYFGWFVEDFEVSDTRAWPPEALAEDVSPPLIPARVAEGTAIGVSVLWTMESSGETLLEFLRGESFSARTELVVTGHSLGGALAPALALALVEAQKKAPFKDGANVTVKAHPTGGATPGDEAFADLVIRTLGEKYQSRVNNWDVVPHAWQRGTAKRISSLYAKVDVTTCRCSDGSPTTGLPKNPIVDGIGRWFVHHPGENSYRRIGVDKTFTGLEDHAPPCRELESRARAVEMATPWGDLDAHLLRAVLQDILHEMTGNPSRKITCDQILGFFQFLNELDYQHHAAYSSSWGFDVPADVESVIHRYTDFAKPDEQAAGAAIYDFMKKVEGYLKAENQVGRRR